MTEAKDGDTVKLAYKARLNDGREVGATPDDQPETLQLGAGTFFPSVEKEIVGMTPGDAKTVTVPSAEAFGPRDPQLIFEVPRDRLPPDLNPEVGQRLQTQQQNGQPAILTVTKVEDQQIEVDANHPLADEDIIFDVHLVEVAA